jgi:hypothetical protein
MVFSLLTQLSFPHSTSLSPALMSESSSMPSGLPGMVIKPLVFKTNQILFKSRWLPLHIRMFKEMAR